MRGSQICIAVLAILSAGLVLAREPLSDAQVRQAIIQESIAAYKRTGHPCACPFDLMRNGRHAATSAPTADRAERHLFASRRMSAMGWLPIGGGRIRSRTPTGGSSRS